MSNYRTMDDGPVSEISIHRVDIRRERAERNAPVNPHSRVDYAKLRKAIPVNEPVPAAFKWVARLPRDVQPLNLLRQYPRVVNNLALTWNDRKAFRDCLYGLLADKRGDRRGFPEPVLKDLMALRAYFEQLDALPDSRPASTNV